MKGHVFPKIALYIFCVVGHFSTLYHVFNSTLYLSLDLILCVYICIYEINDIWIPNIHCSISNLYQGIQKLYDKYYQHKGQFAATVCMKWPEFTGHINKLHLANNIKAIWNVTIVIQTVDNEFLLEEHSPVQYLKRQTPCKLSQIVSGRDIYLHF